MYSLNASEQVVDYIGEHIKNGLWLPGNRIETEKEIGEALGVSRIAVRQGIEKLSALGVLYKIQGSGTYINLPEQASLSGLAYYPVRPELILKILEFRQNFDSDNVRLFIQNANEDEKAALKSCGEKVAETSEEVALFDREFHGIIAEGTHNQIIVKITRELAPVFQHYHTPLFDGKSDIGHTQICQAILQGDEELAYLYCKMHFVSSIEYVKGLMNETVIEKN